MRGVLRAACALACLAAVPALSQPRVSRETIAAPLQPGAVNLPVGSVAAYKEVWHLDGTQIAVRNVVQPTLTPFLPTGRCGGPAVIVAPGGAFLGLAIEKEGWDVARWLANHGIAAFVLKYRLIHTPDDQGAFADELAKGMSGQPTSVRPPDATPPEALADGVAALRFVRAHAADYCIDSKRVGFMGFSAGGFLTLSTITGGGADKPAFAAPIYPNMAAMTVPADAPPMFVAIASDDFLLTRQPGLPLIDSYRAAGKPVEFHLFASGGHGFGLGVPGTPPSAWPEAFVRWLDAIGMLKTSGSN